MHGKENQQWMFEILFDSTYIITSLKTWKVLEAVDGSIVQNGRHGGDSQRWIITMNDDGSFEIKSKESNLVLDVPGSTMVSGKELILYKSHHGINQRWVIEKIGKVKTIMLDRYRFYAIRNIDNELVLGVPNSTNYNEIKIDQEKENGENNQRWIFEYMEDDGSYIITNAATGKVLDVFGNQRKNGVALQQFERHGGNNQRWYLKNYKDGGIIIESKGTGTVLDVPGSNKNPGTTITLYSKHEGTNQRWIIA